MSSKSFSRPRSWSRARLCLLGLALTWQASSQAAPTMSTTRVVYNADRRGVSLLVANPSQNVYAAQA